jgi:hypothetical protein
VVSAGSCGVVLHRYTLLSQNSGGSPAGSAKECDFR